MTFRNFRSLNDEDKHIVLWENAVQIAEREDSRYKYVLYKLNNFYIEIRIAKQGSQETLSIFSNEIKLQPYLKEINIDSLKSIY